jgi:hypothetical protein
VHGLSTCRSHTTIEKDGKVVAAKTIVYAGEDEKYFSFSLIFLKSDIMLAIFL